MDPDSDDMSNLNDTDPATRRLIEGILAVEDEFGDESEDLAEGLSGDASVRARPGGLRPATGVASGRGKPRRSDRDRH